MNTEPKPIELVFTHKPSLAQNSLRYFISTKGQHVIIHTMHAGEDIAPDVYRFTEITDARQQWRKLYDLILNRGYTQISGREVNQTA